MPHFKVALSKHYFIPHLYSVKATKYTYYRSFLRACSTKSLCVLADGQEQRAATPPSSDADSINIIDMLPSPPGIACKDPRISYNATALAFLGDAVWEIFVRRKFFFPPKNMAAYHRLVVESVRAERQAEHYDTLVQGSFLQDQERQILRWGRNATGGSAPKRFSKPHVTREVYRAATAVECLVGYLYLTDMGRLQHLMEHIGLDIDSIEKHHDL